MGVLNFYLSLSCLLAVTHGSPSDCVGEPQGVLPDPATVSGLWNLFAVSLSPNSKYQTDEIAYVYAKVSFNETASSVAVFSNPMSDTNGQLFQHERIPGTQTYKYIPTEALEDVYTTTVFQPHPDILICYERLNNEINGAYLHTQECYGLFEHSEDLKDIEGCETWGLVAKASNYADRNYHIRLLYSAKLELCKTEEAYTFKEIQIAGDEKILMELKFENRTTGDKLKLQSFKTGTDMLLLGVQNEKQSTLFLASKTSKVKQTILDEFAMEAHCFEATFTYLVPGSKEEESHAENQ
ncbi:uncharacterized protein LOC121397774 isoform X2 [Xenopus laevis]|uniref:Uncharacterized protein LOC121397774 isoform X2 n=1 Tax=Xenopus laevis TaxID=8355 RepID=A0A8J1LNR9_XENLA|nr:uncharacterized protein LOC121397774 isoform X2 [Xenopus laevis]